MNIVFDCEYSGKENYQDYHSQYIREMSGAHDSLLILKYSIWISYVEADFIKAFLNTLAAFSHMLASWGQKASNYSCIG